MSDNSTSLAAPVRLPVRPKRGQRTGNRRYVGVEVVPTTTGSTERYVVKDAGLRLIEQAAARGASLAEQANLLGIGAEAYKRMRRDDPRIDDAIDAGGGRLEMRLNDLLLDRIERDDDKSHLLLMFALKAKCGYRDTGPDARTPTTAVQVNVNIPQPLPAEEVQKIIGVIPDAD